MDTLGSTGTFYDSVPPVSTPTVEFFVLRPAMDQLQVNFFVDAVVDEAYGTLPYYDQPNTKIGFAFSEVDAISGSLLFENVLETLWTQGLIILVKLKWDISVQ